MTEEQQQDPVSALILKTKELEFKLNQGLDQMMKAHNASKKKLSKEEIQHQNVQKTLELQKRVIEGIH